MPTISLACVDTKNHSKAMFAVQQTVQVLHQAHVNVSKIYWFSDIKYSRPSLVPVTWYPISTITQFPRDYNQILLRTLPEICSEDFVLIVQNDGYAVNADSWSDGFFSYDYIGAVWPYQQMSHIFPGLYEQYQDAQRVGNGGFSLRSQKLMQALLNISWENHWHQNEDHLICNDFRTRLDLDYGIKFAPAHVADQFSIEWNTSSKWFKHSFGFHSTRIEPLYNPGLLQLPTHEHDWQKTNSAKTLLFCTGYAQTTQIWNQKYLSWINNHLQSPLDYNQMLIVDDASPCLPDWCNIHIQQADYTNAGHPITLHRFSTRAGQNDFLSGWWRSFGYALTYALQNNFSRVVHIEADAQLVSEQAYNWFNSVDQGWSVLWCPKHNFPEAAFQVINQDKLMATAEFFQTPYKDHEPVKAWGLVPEDFLPFTAINKSLQGDRYSEYPMSVPSGIDFIAQLYG